MKRFGGSANHDVRKPSSGAPSKKLNTVAEVEKPSESAAPNHRPEWSGSTSQKMERRIMAAGESSLAQKDGALPPLPPMSKAQIHEFIKMYFPPGYPLPK